MDRHRDNTTVKEWEESLRANKKRKHLHLWHQFQLRFILLTRLDDCELSFSIVLTILMMIPVMKTTIKQEISKSARVFLWDTSKSSSFTFKTLFFFFSCSSSTSESSKRARRDFFWTLLMEEKETFNWTNCLVFFCLELFFHEIYIKYLQPSFSYSTRLLMPSKHFIEIFRGSLTHNTHTLHTSKSSSSYCWLLYQLTDKSATAKRSRCVEGEIEFLTDSETPLLNEIKKLFFLFEIFYWSVFFFSFIS